MPLNISSQRIVHCESAPVPDDAGIGRIYVLCHAPGVVGLVGDRAAGATALPLDAGPHVSRPAGPLDAAGANA